MKKILSFASLVTIGLTFSACAPSYNIEPVYNKDVKSVNIDKMEIKNVRDEHQASFPNTRGFVYSTKKFKLNDANCKEFFYQKNKAMKNGNYYYDSRYESLISRYTGGLCNVTSISDINFLSCSYTKNDDGKKFYHLTKDIKNQWGYGSKEQIDFYDETCFNSMKNYYINLAKKDNVEVKEYIDKIELANDIKIYLGDRIGNATNHITCVPKAKVRLFIDSENNLKGFSEYEYMNNQQLVKLSGNTKEFKSPGAIMKVTKYDDESLEATYSYDNSDHPGKCTGIVKLKREIQ